MYSWSTKIHRKIKKMPPTCITKWPCQSIADKKLKYYFTLLTKGNRAKTDRNLSSGFVADVWRIVNQRAK